MAELNTFGAVLSFAIQLEADIQRYYQQAGRDDRAKDAEKRKGKLEKARREHVLEITLEPIEGLEEADYLPNFSDVSAEGQQHVAQSAAAFYAAAAPKINVQQARRVLEKCGQEHRAQAG
ncbi:MAG: hypothetical protein SF029_07615 [bacterium]|nr:hypothetical protein [bacterium]